MKKLYQNDPAAPYRKAAFRGCRWNLAAQTVCTALDSVMNTLIAVILQMTIDVAAGDSEYSLSQIAVFIAGVVAAWLIVELANRELTTRFVRRVNRQYKQAIFAEVTKKNIAAFSSEQTGTYISMLTADAATVDEKYFRQFTTVMSYALNAVLGLVLMLLYSWELALIAIALSCLPMLLSMAFGGTLVRREKAVSEENAGFVAAVKDLLSGFSVVKSFQAEAEAQSLFRRKCADTEEAKYRSLRMSKIFGFLGGMAAFAMQMGVFLIGAYMTLRGRIGAGVVIAFVQLSGMVVNSVQQLPRLLAERKAARGLIDKAARTLSGNAAPRGGAIVDSLGDGIVCRELRFGYTPDSETLRDIDLAFEPGKRYAIVGASGSGKSTLLNLLLGSYDGYGGSVTVGGREVRDIAPDSLYGLISVIQQNVFIFDSTIAENITMFKDFPQEAVESAVRRAGLSDLLREKGMDYRCGENGCNLSGGERQRISIARCLLKNTEVLLMDEATAALDAQTAASVTDAILRVDGLTRIIVTHKLDEALLRRFDEILVFRGGSIPERGTFDALLAKNGYFSALYRVSRDA